MYTVLPGSLWPGEVVKLFSFLFIPVFFRKLPAIEGKDDGEVMLVLPHGFSNQVQPDLINIFCVPDR